MLSSAAIQIDNLSKQYRIGKRERYRALRDTLTDVLAAPARMVRSIGGSHEREEESTAEWIWALKDVSFEVEPGEVIGVIGRNGAGKSTLLKILSRITEPTQGTAKIRGHVASLLEVGTGFHPELSGRENIYLNGAIVGMKRATIRCKFDSIVAFAEIERFVDTPVKHYSSGMYLRLAFSVSAHLDSDILLIDEVLAVGDADFQKRCLGKMTEVAQGGRTVVFVSHNMSAVRNLCGTGIWLDRGEVRQSGRITDVVAGYLKQSRDDSGVMNIPRRQGQHGDALHFTAVRILESGGNPTSLINSTEGCWVEIEYRVTSPIRQAQVAFELWTITGNCILCSSDLDAEPELAAVSKDIGLYRASSFLPPSVLRPGEYFINLGSSIPNKQLLDEFLNAISFEVFDGGGIEFKLSQGRRGVILPILRWTTVHESEKTG